MATATYFLRNGKDASTIYVIYRHLDKEIRFNTKVKIDPKYWNDSKSKIDHTVGVRKTKSNQKLLKELTDLSNSDTVNIQAVKAKVLKIARDLQYKKIEPTIDRVSNEFCIDKPVKKMGFVELRDEYLANCKINKTPGTYRQIKTGLKAFADFASRYKYNLSFDMFSLKLYDKYRAYLHEEITEKGEVIKKGLNNNTTGTRIKVLKSFLNWLKDHGYSVNPEYEKYRVLRENPQIVYLTQAEMVKLEKKEFKKAHLNRTKDLFLFQCNTGLRISDLMRLDTEHIRDDIIQMRALKNKNKIFVPLTSTAKRILEKYDNKLPIVAEQVYNRQLKDMAELASLDRKVEVTNFKGGKKIFNTVPLHRLVKSHIARKTFISICVEKGIQPKVVCEMTGISVKVLIDHYYGTDKDNIIREMQKAFGTNLKVS